MNINTNYISCPKCKNMFLRTHIKVHYQKCNGGNKLAQTQAQTLAQAQAQAQALAQAKALANSSNTQKTNSQIITPNNLPDTPKLRSYISSNDSDRKNRVPESPDSQTIVSQTIVSERTDSQTIVSERTVSQNADYYLEKYIPPEIASYTDNVIIFFFKKYEALFREFVSGKCVALVGPSQSIIDTGKGHIIDTFDLVVRLNKALPLPKNIQSDIGTRTDIIYNSLNTSDFPGENNLSPRMYKKYGVKFVCSSYPFNHQIFKPDILSYVYKYKFEIPLKVMEDSKFKNFENSLKTRPYTGTCAIMDLLSYPIKYLYITGMDFYQTKYYSEYRYITKERLKSTRNSMIHQSKPQLDYLKNISLLDSRVILDSHLDKLLYYDYYKTFKLLKEYDKDKIFKFGDTYFQKYFELKLSFCSMTINDQNIANNSIQTNNPFLILTNNKKYRKMDNEYCILVSNSKDDLLYLNNNMEKKKFIGNFYFNEGKSGAPSIYLDSKFLSLLKSILTRVGITNCNIYLVILLAIILYLPDKHYFSSNEVFNNWKLNNNEKKLVLFLSKKKILNLI